MVPETVIMKRKQIFSFCVVKDSKYYTVFYLQCFFFFLKFYFMSCSNDLPKTNASCECTYQPIRWGYIMSIKDYNEIIRKSVARERKRNALISRLKKHNERGYFRRYLKVLFKSHETEADY